MIDQTILGSRHASGPDAQAPLSRSIFGELFGDEKGRHHPNDTFLHRLRGFEFSTILDDSDLTVAHTAFRITSRNKNEPLTSRLK